MKTPHRIALVALCLGLSMGCDQATKRIATETLASSGGHSFLWDVFRLQYAENRGAFLSLGANLPDSARFWLLTVTVGLILAAMLGYTLLNRRLSATEVVGYTVIGGGGLSNWIDRATRSGVVVDFMNLGLGSELRTGIFNVADLAILAGIGLLLFASWRKDRKAEAEATP